MIEECGYTAVRGAGWTSVASEERYSESDDRVILEWKFPIYKTVKFDENNLPIDKPRDRRWMLWATPRYADTV